MLQFKSVTQPLDCFFGRDAIHFSTLTGINATSERSHIPIISNKIQLYQIEFFLIRVHDVLRGHACINFSWQNLCPVIYSDLLCRKCNSGLNLSFCRLQISVDNLNVDVWIMLTWGLSVSVFYRQRRSCLETHAWRTWRRVTSSSCRGGASISVTTLMNQSG